MAAFVGSSVISAGAGFVELGLVGSASVTIGPDFLLPALAACFLGTTTSVNGRFNLFGTTVAIFLIAVGVTGLEQLGVPTWVEPIFDGVALLTAVTLTVMGQRARSRRHA
jgi:ribose transport system permease protein